MPKLARKHGFADCDERCRSRLTASSRHGTCAGRGRRSAVLPAGRRRLSSLQVAMSFRSLRARSSPPSSSARSRPTRRRLRHVRRLGAQSQRRRAGPRARVPGVCRARRAEGAKILGEALERFAVRPRAASTASASSQSATARSGSASPRRIAAPRSTRAATSSTRPSSVCRSGRKSTTATASRAG